MHTLSGRRLFASAMAGAVMTAGAVAISAAPAQAATTGQILASTVSNSYSAADFMVMTVSPGASYKKFYLKVVNTSATAEQLKVVLAPSAGGTAKLYKGYSALPDTYLTPTIPAGGSLALTLRVSLPADAATGGTYANLVTIRDPESDAGLDAFYAYAETAAAAGTTDHDLYFKTGSQPYAGGSADSQYLSSAPIKVGGTATYSVRLRNNGTVPSAIGFQATDLSGCPVSVTVKQGFKDVTGAAFAGSYSTGTLRPGSYKTLTIKVKSLTASFCVDEYLLLSASGPGGAFYDVAHVIFAA